MSNSVPVSSCVSLSVLLLHAGQTDAHKVAQIVTEFMQHSMASLKGYEINGSLKVTNNV